MKVAIISHTDHYLNASAEICGWGPTVRELNYLATKWEEIFHIACMHDEAPPASSIAYTSKNIRFIPIPPTGGQSIKQKLSVLTSAPSVIQAINSLINEVDAIQLRVPTGIANYLLPYLSMKRHKPLIWVKYAGNWNQENAPAGYRFQRWWLNNNFLKCKVTINGSWRDQLPHCVTFENPCLDDDERRIGKEIINKKDFSGPYTASFIGRIETEKGVKRIIDALPEFAAHNIKTINFIGEGKERPVFENLAAAQKDVRCVFHSSMAREEISNFLIQSHFLLLPSTASEGFPKVIAEGANYGAIPIVSDISSIGQYINSNNGFVWDHQTNFNDWVRQLHFTEEDLISKSRQVYDVAEQFTFSSYYNKLQAFIFK